MEYERELRVKTRAFEILTEASVDCDCPVETRNVACCAERTCDYCIPAAAYALAEAEIDNEDATRTSG
jgi:hypothetical protein